MKITCDIIFKVGCKTYMYLYVYILYIYALICLYLTSAYWDYRHFFSLLICIFSYNEYILFCNK